MKPKPHFLPKRQTVIYGFTEQMLRDTGSNRRSFAMAVADTYLSLLGGGEHLRDDAPDLRPEPAGWLADLSRDVRLGRRADCKPDLCE
ncbi:conserved hypothetical protein [Stenotrophomonas indicatrix]|nr:conserved hypothetical protein [Stenotrophomonas indicatrix]